MCAEGGAGADIKYIDPSDNRGAGSWVGNHLEEYNDGTRVLFVIEGGKTHEEKTEVIQQSPPAAATAPTIFKNCSEVKEAGKAPLHKGEPGYSSKLDRDGGGVACE
nr:excalibur calcium-binding domain-containing protein [Paenibacillus gorillae]